MATVTTATVRERLATSLNAGMPTGWRQSVFSPSQIGRDGGPGSRMWSVEIPNTTVLQGRHRVKSGGGYVDEPWEVEDDIRIRWVVQVRADGAIADYATGLDVDGLVLRALYTGVTPFVSTNTTAPMLVDSSRSMVADGAFLLGEMRFSLKRLFGLPAVVLPPLAQGQRNQDNSYITVLQYYGADQSTWPDGITDPTFIWGPNVENEQDATPSTPWVWRPPFV